MYEFDKSAQLAEMLQASQPDFLQLPKFVVHFASGSTEGSATPSLTQMDQKHIPKSMSDFFSIVGFL